MAGTMHLAQLNVGRLRYPSDDPRVADFMNNLERVNAIAERSPGFVWRLKDDTGNATSIRPFADPTVLINLGVWENAESLERFVWQTVHKRFYNRKGEWFQSHSEPYFVMWPVAVGHIPSLEEAGERLEHLRAHGSTDYAFGWEHLPHINLWRTERCA
ncbi:MAG: DUF3291 domain-containing protein [Bauldia sp.]|nr:DUF3291 domain-containing protein [Bauldia sp.]